MRSIPLFILFLSLALLSSCSSSTHTSTPNESSPQTEKGDKKKGEKDKSSEPTPTANTNTTRASAAACDKTLWDHVYNPERLQVQKDCMTVSGTITERSTDDDGDEHMLLKLDDGQDDLLTKKNKKKKDGDLVIEAICAGQPKLQKVGEACSNFSNSIPFPQVGDHVRVTGSYVLDTHNGWAEIHPISSIEHE